jgi:phospho-N-acetylmuramoyl-pentapeptide-transferase
VLYYLLYPLKEYWGVFNLFRYITFRSAYAVVTAILITFIFGPLIVKALRKWHIVETPETIRDEGLQSHKRDKAGIPSMGGLIILLSTLVPTLLWADISNSYVLIAISATAIFGLVGFLDDYLKLVQRKKAGLLGRFKLISQILVGLALGLFLYLYPLENGMTTILTVPFFKSVVIPLGIFYILFVMIVIVGSTNAVNLTDGLDGLAIGTVAFAAMAYAGFCYIVGNFKFADYLQVMFIDGVGELTVFMSAMLGAAIGFLWYNAHPAEVFMGDTGSLALGGAIGTIAVLIKQELLLVIVGGVFVIEAVSVIVQVFYFKMSGGRRVFKMSPIHYHYRLLGIPESKVVIRFWILAAMFALISLSTLKIR